MTVDEKLIDEIAHLSRLEFNDESKTAMMNDLNKMLAFVEKLNELDTENVEPLIYMTEEYNMMREDKVETTIDREEALKNAPKRDSDYFRVPKVIG